MGSIWHRGVDNTLKLWRVSDGQQVRVYDEEMGTGVWTLAYSPDGTRFAYGRMDATVVMARNPFTGDADSNGCTDDADLLLVLFAFGQSGSGLSGDVNGDGTVDDADLLLVLFYFGSGC